MGVGHQASWSWGLLSALCLALAGCGPRVGEGRDAGRSFDGGEAWSFERIEEDIFVPKCTGTSCHAPDPPPRSPMSLEDGLAWHRLVGVTSTQVPSLSRVEPFDPERSYLVAKLRGTAGNLLGAPTRMPLGQPALAEEEILAIEDWILRGAPND